MDSLVSYRGWGEVCRGEWEDSWFCGWGDGLVVYEL